ncbi:MAG: glycosyl hydrolase [Maribacter sp.]
MKQLFLGAFLCCFLTISAQISSSSAMTVEEALQQKSSMQSKSLVQNILFKNIGPTVMSGRVADIDINPNDPAEFYVGYAAGGLWHTRNNGTTFTPIMDNAPTQNIGDIAIDWKNRVIWVGTGENISSRSSYAGIGILKSTDQGKTWQNMGLKDAHHFGRIVINPNNSEEVVVGVTGHLYSPNEERGIYKTIDGGITWKKTLFVDDVTGIIDLAHDPNNFNIMYASAWEKDRKAWNFVGNGNASGIYKSTDGGNNWLKISTPESGFPTGEGVGRIGFAVYDENTVYAVHDSQFRRQKSGASKEKIPNELQEDDFKNFSKDDFFKLKDGKLDAFLKSNRFPKKYTAKTVKKMVEKGEILPIDLFNYLQNENSVTFDTPVVGAEVYRSDDAGVTWKKQNEDYIDDLFYSYGYVFAQIRVDAYDKDHIYLLGVPIIKSKDAGKTYTSINGDNVHVDHHSLWVNPKRPGHLINGNDGGLNMSYDDGENWTKLNSEALGTFFAINIDHQEPYNVYGGLQDNGVWMGPHNSDQNTRWHSTGHYPWKGINGGDGMQIQIDNRNPNIVYTGSQFGYYSRLDLEKESRTFIMPKNDIGTPSYRFNWETPILLSSHNQDILYMGTNQLLRSMNQGDDFDPISPDLTNGGKKGNVAYGTLTSISESPFQFGLIYTTSDDGLLQVTKNGGGSWEEISRNITFSGYTNNNPIWAAQVVASSHKKEWVYAAFSGYRWDDFSTYLYSSDDYGKTWASIGKGIPDSPVNVIIEDPVNENLLFVGTDNGLYTSLDRGATWNSFQNGIPNVAIHDLAIQPEAKHLLVGSHGRSIYKADIAPLQALTPEVMTKDLFVFKLENIKHSERWGGSRSSWRKPNTPGQDIVFYTSKADTFKITVKSGDEIVVSATEMPAERGVNILSFDVAFSKAGRSAYLKKHKTELKQAKDGKTYLPKGNYEVEIVGNGTKEKTAFEIE